MNKNINYDKYYILIKSKFPNISKEEAKILTNQLFEFWEEIIEKIENKDCF